MSGRYPIDVLYSRDRGEHGRFSGTATTLNDRGDAPWSLTLRRRGLVVHELTDLRSRRRAEFLLYAWCDHGLAPAQAIPAEVGA